MLDKIVSLAILFYFSRRFLHIIEGSLSRIEKALHEMRCQDV